MDNKQQQNEQNNKQALDLHPFLYKLASINLQIREKINELDQQDTNKKSQDRDNLPWHLS